MSRGRPGDYANEILKMHPQHISILDASEIMGEKCVLKSISLATVVECVGHQGNTGCKVTYKSYEFLTNPNAMKIKVISR